MSNPKYIDADKFWDRLISVSENDWVGFDTIDEVLSGMPAEPRWIPVTERLPEEGSYLCTENHLGTIFVDVSCFDGKQWCLPNGNPHFVTKVLAWMPLPSPFLGE